MTTCWLCAYNKDPEAVRLTRYINENAANMGTEQLALAVHERLEEVDAEGEGHTLDDIKTHILLHMVSPSVKIPGILRSLIGILDKVESSLQSTEDGQVVMDAKNVQLYLKIVNEVMQIYKTGESSRLLFSETNTTTLDGKK